MAKATIHYEKAVTPIVIAQGHHHQVKVGLPRSRKAALGEVKPQRRGF